MTNEYYVYAYYLKLTNEIFHIGKGKRNRYKETEKSRNQYSKSLKIKKLDRSVSTNRDECSDVEWRLQPFEVPGNFIE